jgi:hypothetical protein
MRSRTLSFALPRLGYSKPEAAYVAGVGLTEIKIAVRDGDLDEVQMRGRRRLILHDDLENWLKARRIVRRTEDAAAELFAPRADPPRRRGRPPKSAAAR